MGSTTRTFIAVAVPEALETKLTRLQQQLAAALPGVRWSATPPFHVTLAFLGEVDVADLNQVCKAVVDEAAAWSPFELKLEGLGVFPSPVHPRVLWTAVAGSGVEALRALQKAVAEAVARKNYPSDAKAFHPHVTLGRFPPQKSADPSSMDHALNHMLGHYKTWHAGPFAVTEAVAFASTTARDGPAYATLVRAPLRKRKTGQTP